MSYSSETTEPCHPQQVIKAKCFHPSGSFVKFREEEIEQSIPDRFEQQVVKFPDRIAVKTGNCTLTYDALNKLANRIARAILAQHQSGQKRIAFLLDNDALMIAAILGVLKAGKVYVPLDPSLPSNRTSYIIKDSQANLVVTNNKNLSLANELFSNAYQLINVDSIDSSLSAENPGLSLSPDALAYILYTSGS